MKPKNLKTRIFLDSGDPKETKQTFNMLGFLDGQTTNPTLISKNPQIQEQIKKGKKFSKEEVYREYKKIIQEINGILHRKEQSISIEVYADDSTAVTEMVDQALDMSNWIKNAHIKLPITDKGLMAANTLIKMGVRLNMTLCFTQEQAAAVYSATKGAYKGQVFVSPFVGRLDDKGKDGMSLIKDIIDMYKDGDGHVEALTASVRNLNHFLYALQLRSNIITVSLEVLKQWVGQGLLLPDDDFKYESELKSIKYKDLDLNKNWQEFNIHHRLTDIGLEKFAKDWHTLIK